MIVAMAAAINQRQDFPQVAPTLNSRQPAAGSRVPEFLGDIKGLDPTQKG
ncbi:hypothetical protein [Bradyrhizobium sp. ORS 111]